MALLLSRLCCCRCCRGSASARDTWACHAPPPTATVRCCAQVIALHNAFLSAALERSLLTQVTILSRVNSLLAAAADLGRQAAALSDDAEPGASGASGEHG